MRLDNFFYYFSLEGKTGGVQSVSFAFLPQTSGGQDEREELKRVLKADFAALETLVEEALLRQHGLQFKKTPILVDSPATFSAGFKFAVQVEKGFLKKNILGLSSSDVVELTYRIKKHSWEGEVELKANLGHDLNLKTLEEILALPDLLISPVAEREINNMRRVVAMEPGADPKSALQDF